MSTLFKFIYTYLLTPMLLTTIVAIGSGHAWAYSDDSCGFGDDSWSTLADISPYLTDISAQRNFERTLLQSRQIQAAESFVPAASREAKPGDNFSTEHRVSVEDEQNCSRESLVEGAELCSDVVETPISTAPTLFTAYQAKRAANAIFETVNAFYHRVDEKLREEGRLHSSQPRPERGDTYLIGPLNQAPPSDAVAIKVLLSPRLAISKYFSSLPSPPARRVPFEASCRRTTSNNTACGRIPFDSPHGFKLASHTYASLASSNTPPDTFPATYTKITLRFSFPEILSLAHQRFLEVALPPPQAEKTFFLLSFPPFTLT